MCAPFPLSNYVPCMVESFNVGDDCMIYCLLKEINILPESNVHLHSSLLRVFIWLVGDWFYLIIIIMKKKANKYKQ